MLDAIHLEAMGKPTLTIIQDRFERAALMHAKLGGLPELPLFIEPAPPAGASINRNVAELVATNFEGVLRALTVAIES